jgi:hypothetical protein
MPTVSRPGNNRASVAISMVVGATLRSGADRSPIATVIRLVVASIAVAVAIPLP